jgi:hypothetical protein
MDLSTLAVSLEAVTYQLRHLKTGEPLFDDKTKEPIAFDLYSADHPAVDDADFELARRRLNKAMAEAAAAKTKKGKKAETQAEVEVTKEEADEDRVEALVSAIAGGRHITVDGQPLAFSKENARKLLSDPRFKWIRRQLQRFHSDLANFLPPSPTT